MEWQALDMEMERWQRDFDRRVEEGRREIRERVEGVERRCRETEAARRREWEELKGRVMTAQEEQRHSSDGFLKLLAAVTDEYLAIARDLHEDIQQQSAERRAEFQGQREEFQDQREALLRILDRLPPKD